MPLKATLDMVQSNWCKSISGMHISPSQFYESVTKAIQKEQVPGLEFSRVWWKESAFIGAAREYLRIEQGRYVFDICAAQYGAGSFISSWLSIVPFRLSAWHLAGILVSAFLLSWLPPISMLLIAVWLLTGIAWGMYHRVVVTTSAKSDFLLGLTGVGPLFKAISEARPTYYQLDAAGVFQSVVQEGVMEAINELCTEQNLRPLTELERKPSAIEFRKK